jgi:hypothetical protein
MTAFQIKIIAIVTMLIDHVGFFLFPQVLWLRMIGRLSFPLFAWLIANGARHTHNPRAYLLRLFVFACLSQIPFVLSTRYVLPTFDGINVLFTLLFGLCAIQMIRMTENKSLWVFITVLFAALGQSLHADYGFFGVASVIFFYLFFDSMKAMIVAQFLLFSLYILFGTQYYEILGLYSLFFIGFYNGKRGVSAQYLFYVIYPLQFVIFYLVFRLML